MTADVRNQEKSEPPAYMYEDLVERVFGKYSQSTLNNTHHHLFYLKI